MTTLRKTLVPIGIILALVVGGLFAVKKFAVQPRDGGSLNPGAPSGAPAVKIAEGETLPDFSLTQFGGSVQPVSKLGAKVVLVNFWATWCEACMVEMPSIIALRKRFKARGFEVAAINVDQNPESVLPSTLKKLGIDFPVYTDQDTRLSELFDVHAIPLSVVLDRNRKIVMIESGERNWDDKEMQTRMERWLSP